MGKPSGSVAGKFTVVAVPSCNNTILAAGSLLKESISSVPVYTRSHVEAFRRYKASVSCAYAKSPSLGLAGNAATFAWLVTPLPLPPPALDSQAPVVELKVNPA
jgi:hypothetical protein